MNAPTWDALVNLIKDTYTAGLAAGTVPRPVIMPLVRDELIGMVWVRPISAGQDAFTAIAELADIAVAAGADEIILAWETHTAAACQLPVADPFSCLNMLTATSNGHTLHQFPYTEAPLGHSPEGHTLLTPHWSPQPPPQPGGELIPPIQAVLNLSFTPIELDHPDPFLTTVMLMQQDGYRVRLTEDFAR